MKIGPDSGTRGGAGAAFVCVIYNKETRGKGIVYYSNESNIIAFHL